MDKNYVLEMKNIEKDYYGNKVLKGINLKLEKGEIHALLGENGAGKSTLMNTLFGMPVILNTGGFKGEVLIDGKSSDIRSPEDAMKMGIGMVHQEFMLIPGYTVTENIKLNREITKSNALSKIFNNKKLEHLMNQEMRDDAERALGHLKIDIDPDEKVEGLPVGYMQFVEIAREIDKTNIKVLVFDEPTAVLTESEAATLLDAMRRIAASGISILFITHRLDEVMQVSDNVTILRDGEQVANKATSQTDVIELAELMVGRKVELTKKEESSLQSQETIMKFEDFYVDMPGEQVKGINLEIRKGEIIGIGGLAGQGKIGIANGVMGLYPASGKVLYKGNELNGNTHDVLKKRISFVSEDRRGVGLLLDQSIEDNIAISAMQVNEEFIKKYGPVKLSDKKGIREHAIEMIEKLDIRCIGSTQSTRRLSGGNQQKVCIARAITLEPEIIFVSEPTRGIDIGAKKLVLDLLVELNKEKNVTVVITSSELAELRTISDRIAIVTEGRIEGILPPDATDSDYGLMMSGDYHKVKSRVS
jgi:simple sugar transport system ATP-binding protein